MVSWKPLTLSEARGFITFYTIEYYAASEDDKKRQAPSQILLSAESSSATIGGLDEDLNYIVQVSASTRAGGGVESRPQEVDTFIESFENEARKTFVNGVIGGVVGSVFIVLLIGTVVVVIVFLAIKTSRYRKKNLALHE